MLTSIGSASKVIGGVCRGGERGGGGDDERSNGNERKVGFSEGYCDD